MAGPFELTLGGVGAHFESPDQVVWFDDLGLLGEISNPDTPGVSLGVIVQLDGVACGRTLDGLDGRLGHNLPTGGLGVTATFTYFPAVDLRSLQAAGDSLFVDGAHAVAWTVLPDGRIVYAYNGKVYVRSGGSMVEEATLGSTGVTGYGAISPGRGGTVFVAWKGGRIFEYDWVAKAAVGEVRFVEAGLGGPWFSPALGVFVSLAGTLGGAQYVSVWADEVAASSLSAPAALDAVKPGTVVRVRSQLLGDQSEPVVGWPVGWSLSGAGATLVAEQTLTDEDGYAVVGVRVDPATAVAAAFDVTATVL